MITKTIDRWGNSQGVRLPKDMLKKIGIEDPVGVEVTVDIQDNELVIKKADNRSSLEKRFAGFDVENYFKNNGSREIEWGESVGKEQL